MVAVLSENDRARLQPEYFIESDRSKSRLTATKNYDAKVPFDARFPIKRVDSRLTIVQGKNDDNSQHSNSIRFLYR